MALIEILPDTHPVMRKTCRKVKHVDDEFRKLVEDMYETMVDSVGIGLAAPQVGVEKRFFIYEVPMRDLKGYETCEPDDDVVDELESEGEEASETSGVEVSEVEAELEELLDDDEEDEEDEEDESGWGYTGEYSVCINPRITSREGVAIDEEGCLSKSGWIAKVERAFRITFQAYDLEMNKFDKTVEGMEARCILHETDHLDGILFTDRAIEGSLREVSDIEEELDEDSDDGADEAEDITEETEESEIDDVNEAVEESSVVKDA